MSLFRIFYGIGEDIDYDLLDPDLITVKDRGNIPVNIQVKDKPLVFSFLLHHIHKIVKKGDETVIDIYDLHFPCFDLGEIKDIIYDAQQGIPRCSDALRIHSDVFVLRIPDDHFV